MYKFLFKIFIGISVLNTVTIKAQSQDFEGYLFAYFEGSGEGNMQEQLRFAVSDDAMDSLK